MDDCIETWDHEIVKRDQFIDKMIIRYNEKAREADKAWKMKNMEKLRETVNELEEELKSKFGHDFKEKDLIGEISVPKYFVFPCSCWDR